MFCVAADLGVISSLNWPVLGQSLSAAPAPAP